MKRKKSKVVFTNGCFDLLHKGHIDLLNKASQYGSKLIVGLNSDNSVRNLKGRNRPVENQIIRKAKLLKLSCVDEVQIFYEKNPLKLIYKIRPQVLVKGGDYLEKDVVGAVDVSSWGGSTIIIPLTPGYSTTASIEKLKK